MKSTWHKNTIIFDNKREYKERISHICGIVSAMNKNITPLSNLVDILSSLHSKLYLIIGYFEDARYIPMNKKVHIYPIEHKVDSGVSARVVNYLWTQLRISRRLMKLSRNIDTWIFFIGGGHALLPVLTAKLLKKRVVIAAVDSGLEEYLKIYLFVKVLVFIRGITYRLSDRIILHSPNLIKEWNLEKYKNKISIAHEYFINLDKFKIQKSLNNRENVVGYIGRLSEEKGILNFIKALPTIIKEKDDLEFLIGGDGPLRDEIEKYINEENLNNKVKLLGWIPHDKLPNYLNELKLLVIPSYTESGPIIAMEAMACGTPILATRTGHVLEMIEDGKTGFIMENNSPECIARNVIKDLNHSNLEQITKNARALVEREFTYEKAVEGYRSILASLSS